MLLEEKRGIRARGRANAPTGMKLFRIRLHVEPGAAVQTMAPEVGCEGVA